MIEFRGLWLPDGEEHLQEWMTKVGHTRDGLPTYQYHKYERVVKLCRQRRVAVDVGAHVGLWSRVMALDFGRIICFEPKAEHRECWLANMGNVAHAELHSCALGPEAGTVSLTTGPSSSGDTYVDPVAGASGGIEMRTLDSFELPVVDFLKIDCEGYEPMVLAGAVETLERCKPVICVEQKVGHGQKYGISDTAALPFLERLGYRRAGGIQGDYFLTPPE